MTYILVNAHVYLLYVIQISILHSRGTVNTLQLFVNNLEYII